jgi:putative membrane protein
MENAGLRDKLALERTRLANERTFLAYVRTALSLIAGGVVLLQFFTSEIILIVSGWALIIFGGIVFLIGIWRFARVKSHLKSSDSPKESQTE